MEGRYRRRGNTGIHFDLPQLSPHLRISRHVNEVRSSFCVLPRAKMQRKLEQRYAIKFCAKSRKIWFRNVVVVENSLWGMLFCLHHKSSDGKGFQGRKGER